MTQEETLKIGGANNKLNAKIVDYLTLKGIEVFESNDNFEKALNLIKDWEDHKLNQPENISILNSDQIFEIVLKRIEEYEAFVRKSGHGAEKFNYLHFKDYNNNCR